MLHTRRKQKILSMVLSVILAFSVVPLNSIIVKAKNTDIKSLAEVPAGYEAIYTIEDLYGIRNDLGGKYILMNDIDMSKATEKGGDYDCGTGWEPIEDFEGILDGNGHRIVGMHIFGKFSKGIVLGLFGEIGDAVIQNLGIVDCDIDVTAESYITIGSIVGKFYGSTQNCIKNCYATGNIKVEEGEGEARVTIGGLVGTVMADDYRDAFISNCYNGCNVDCASILEEGSVGGICGSAMWGVFVKQCYNTGKIQANKNWEFGVGSICGGGYNFENCCYLRGTADVAVGTEEEVPGCRVLSEVQMKTKTSFIGYDFSNVWEIDPYCSYVYPQLKNNRMIRINSIKLDSMPTKLTYDQGKTRRKLRKRSMGRM